MTIFTRSFIVLFAIVAVAAIWAMPSSASAAVSEDSGVFRTACVTYGNVVPVGGQLTFAAGHFGGQGEVTYRWFGAIEGDGEFMRPTFTSPGPKLITVMATDEDGRTATAGCPVVARIGAVPHYENLQATGGVGGAPVYPAQPGAGSGEPTITPPATGQPEIQTPDAGEDKNEGSTPATEDGDEETEEGGANIGRIILWILIALIIISLFIIFRQKSRIDSGKGTGEKPKEDIAVIPPAPPVR